MSIRKIAQSNIASKKLTNQGTPVNVLLLGSGSNGSTTFIDSSINNFTFTRTGNTVISTAQFPPGMTSSIYFDGTSDNIQTGTNALFGFGSSDGTVECWFYPIALNNGIVWSMRNIGIGAYDNAVRITSAGYFGWSNGAAFVDSTINPITINTWNHLAWSKVGTTVRLWTNGVQSLSTTYSPSQTNRFCSVGAFEGAESACNGYISNFRSIKGVALYTANFTPPSCPLSSQV